MPPVERLRERLVRVYGDVDLLPLPPPSPTRCVRYMQLQRERVQAKFLGRLRKVDEDWETAYQGMPKLQREAVRMLHPEPLFNALSAQPGFEKPEVVLLRASWLIEHAQRGGVLPCRQTIEARYPGALVTVKELRAQHRHFCELTDVPARTDDPFRGNRTTYISQLKAVPIVAISYKWRGREHPDPEGRTLREVARMLLRETRGERATESFRTGYASWGFTDVGVFWLRQSLSEGLRGRPPEGGGRLRVRRARAHLQARPHQHAAVVCARADDGLCGGQNPRRPRVQQDQLRWERLVRARRRRPSSREGRERLCAAYVPRSPAATPRSHAVTQPCIVSPEALRPPRLARRGNVSRPTRPQALL